MAAHWRAQETYAQARSFFAGDGFGMDVQYHSLNESA
jgi:hypothetical protein